MFQKSLNSACRRTSSFRNSFSLRNVPQFITYSHSIHNIIGKPHSDQVGNLTSSQQFSKNFRGNNDTPDTPEYILPRANQTEINLFVLIALIVGGSAGFFLHTLWEAIASEDEGTKEEHTPTFEDQFNELADVENDNDEKFMTIETFIKSLIGYDGDTFPSWIAIPRVEGDFLVNKNVMSTPFMHLIQLADLNGDNRISKNEFVFFHTLLFSNEDMLKIAFNLFDSDGNGRVDYNEFCEILSSVSKVSIDIGNNGLTQSLFGNGLKNEITFQQFQDFIASMKHELLKLEFAQRDRDGIGMISVEDFSELITKSKHFNSIKVPLFKRQLNLLKTKGYFRPSGRINFETFEAFRQVADSLDKVEAAMKLLQATNQPVNREMFTRALTRVGEVIIPESAIELIFAIFDDDGDGYINEEEFLKAFGRSKSTNEDD